MKRLTPSWKRNAAVDADAREQRDGYRNWRAREAAERDARDAEVCVCGDTRGQHEVFDGKCERGGCKCAGFTARKPLAVESL